MAKQRKRNRSRVQSQAGMGHCPRCVRITEADNGFTVSTYGPRGEQIKVAKNSAEALRHTREMMGK